MARYLTFKYGTQKYGTSTVTTRRLTWGIVVDWDNDGILDGTNEAHEAFRMNVKRGRQFFMKSGGDGFQPVDVGEASLSFMNDSGRYDSYNVSGPLYGQLDSKPLIWIIVRDEASGITKDVFKGRITDMRPNYGAIDTVVINARDKLEELKEKNIRSSVYTTIRFDTAIQQCLADAGWVDGSSIDTTVSETMPYWWSSGKDAFSEIMSLVDAGFGRFFIAADGTAVYLSRLSSSTPALTLSDADIQHEYGIQLPSPREVVKNIIRVYARARIPFTNVELWKLADVPLIPAGQSRTIWADFAYNNEPATATSVTTPVATTDYTANTLADGTGTNLTSGIAITITKFATSAKLVVQNNSGSAAYITLLRVRGNAIVPDKFTFAEDSDSASIGQYGERKFSVQSDWLQDINSAIDQTAILKVQLSSPRKFPRVQILRGKPDKQFGADLFSLVSLNFASKGISDEQRIGLIEHNWTDRTGDVVDTFLFFEPNMAGNLEGTWVFPAVFGISTVF
jgi:hypothetical protein